MAIKKGHEDRKERFKAISSADRKALIRAKLKAKGLQEGSGVQEKDLSSYDRDEIWDLIQVTCCFPEMQTKGRTMKANAKPWKSNENLRAPAANPLPNYLSTPTIHCVRTSSRTEHGNPNFGRVNTRLFSWSNREKLFPWSNRERPDFATNTIHKLFFCTTR